MQLAVTGGGTGGHIYPALSVVAALQEPPTSLSSTDILYLGMKDGPEERLATEAGLAFAPVSAAAVVGRNPLAVALGSVRISSGIRQASRALSDFGAQAVLATGGYVSVPVGLAAWRLRIPLLVYLPDREPGLAVKFLSLFAKTIAVTAMPARTTFPRGKTVVTGYPVRPGFGEITKRTARAYLHLDAGLATLLILGGSQGAHALNEAIAQGCGQILDCCQIIHISGTADEAWLRERITMLPETIRARYHLYPYLSKEMPEAMAAADLAVSRSGASVMGEFTITGLPSILVPYPHAGAHQRYNAKYLADVGAAVLLEEERISELVPTALSLLKDPSRLTEMSAHARTLAWPDAAATIGRLIIDLASERAQPASAQTKVS